MGEETTATELLARLESLTGVPASHLEILTGFPPKALSLEGHENVGGLHFRHGDLLTVRRAEAPVRGGGAAPPGSEADPPSSTFEEMHAMVRFRGDGRGNVLWMHA